MVDNCEVCVKNAPSKPKPSVAISRATDFNSVVAIDLMIMGAISILWMICTFKKFLRVVINDETPESIIKGIHEAWCRA